MNQYEQDTIVNVLEHVLLNISNPQYLSSTTDDREKLLLSLFHVLLGDKREGKGLIPIRMDEQIDADMKRFEERIQDSCSCTFLKAAMSYFVSELVCNVEQHAGVKQGFGLVHYNAKSNRLLVGIADGGVSIYGSYVRAQKYLLEVGDSDAQALYLAQNGYSTKNLPNAENRGYGISTNSRMIVEGLGGTFTILSGNALFYHSTAGKRIFALPEDLVWPGTMVLADIPVEEKKFSLYDYIG